MKKKVNLIKKSIKQNGKYATELLKTNWNGRINAEAQTKGIRGKFIETNFPKRIAEVLLKLPDMDHLPLSTLRKSYFIHGENQVGKTILSARIILQIRKYSYFMTTWIDNQRLDEELLTFRFIDEPDLFSKLTAAFSTKDTSIRDVLEEYKTCDVLVVDDIGTEKPSEWLSARFYELINSRYNDMKQTIFTSNLDIEEINNRLGARVGSRIVSMCHTELVINEVGEEVL